ncbi:T9SS type A sorting domain-containing protein, partial [Salibacteraceae bacterium]|nr:T9SS type A sorting domain-containing protein [Salibacteraceae bacterium]
EVAGNDSIDYRYELISENVTQLTSWEVEFCDCFECLIGLTDSGSCRIGPNESFSFKYYVTLPADVKEYTETYISYRITNKADSTNVDTFTWITRKAPDAPEVSVGEYDVTRSEVNVFPNPTDGMVNISFEAISNDLYTLSVMNVLGEMVYTQVLEPTAGNNIASELDFSDLQKGAYFLTLSNGMEIKTERLTIK